MPSSRRRFMPALAALTASLAACGRRDTASSEVIDDPEAPTEPLFPKTAAGELDIHVARLQKRFLRRGWTVLAEPPFAVVGDGPASQVERHAAMTIRWAVSRLEAAYFEKPPKEIITIYLFETDESYARNARELFGELPDTPYGYYSPADKALVMNRRSNDNWAIGPAAERPLPRSGRIVMNIGTGGGTLVHEIVHPYMAANFPECPSWFDEGLASLYEQSAEQDGHIVGLTNWRLAGLQDALKAGVVPSFQVLCETGRGFYEDDPGTNYAQARYLCYWLQENGLLRRYYREFRAKVGIDPTGYDTLIRMVGPDMDGFRASWERFVLALVY
ncbi:MAG: hypothetical protein KC457_15195 [Myxococcales bacterium]|nr:hypothetical protein [Myxococcales bacterium]